MHIYAYIYTPNLLIKNPPWSAESLKFLDGMGFPRVSFLIFRVRLAHDMGYRPGCV